MAFLLNSNNIHSYLLDTNLLSKEKSSATPTIEAKPGKNFSIRFRLGRYDYLIKQESHDLEGQTAGELWKENHFFELLKIGPALQSLQSQLIRPIHFDQENAIIVFPYIEDAKDLSSAFHAQVCEQPVTFPEEIAIQLGQFFSTLHRSTFRRSDCESFCANASELQASLLGCSVRSHSLKPDFLRGLGSITPEQFCVIPTDALKFFRFYQRYPEIGNTIKQLNEVFEPVCVVHNDPRFANFLLTIRENRTVVHPIDWEKWAWGDPLYDLARIVANYLKLWLTSLPVSAELDITTILSRASVPLSAVQPSIAALVHTYLSHFPEILLHRSMFISQIVQFTGLALIKQVQLYIAQKHSFGNVDMAMAQVAKVLLCQPTAAVETVFGCTQEALLEDIPRRRCSEEIGSDFVKNGSSRSPDNRSRANAQHSRYKPLAAK